MMEQGKHEELLDLVKSIPNFGMFKRGSDKGDLAVQLQYLNQSP
jgi:hypothetical protein